VLDVAVCIKRVPETGARITLTPDEQEIDTSYLGFTISPHEECAVEEAVRIVEAHGGSSVVLTLGPAEAGAQLRDAMAIGIDRAVLLETEYNVVEADMQRPKVKDADFIGKEAHLRHRDEEPAAILSTLTVDDNTSPSNGKKRYMLGREPILTKDGKRIVDRKGRSAYVTSAGSGPSVGKHVLLAYLPPEHAEEGNELLVQYMGDRYPVTVAVKGSRSLFDPENTRVRS